MQKSLLRWSFVALFLGAFPAAAFAEWSAPIPGSPAAQLADYLNKTAGGSAAILPKSVPKQVIVYAYGGRDKNIEFQSRANAVVSATPEVLHLKVAFDSDFTAELKAIQKTGAKISKLVIDSHGSAGSSQVFGSADLPGMKGLDAAFAAPADIYFHACNIAVGKAGEDFLKKIGSTLLTKGGSVTGTAGEYADFGNLRYATPDIEGMTLKGYVRYRVYPGGKGDFSYIPVGVQEGAERVDSRIRQAEALARIKTKSDRMMAGLAVVSAEVLEASYLRANLIIGINSIQGGTAVVNANLEGHRVRPTRRPQFRRPAIDLTVDQPWPIRVKAGDAEGPQRRKQSHEGRKSSGRKFRRTDPRRARQRIVIGGTAARVVFESQVYGLEGFARAKQGASWAAGLSAWGTR